MSFEIVRGDLTPMPITLTNTDGSALDATAATAILFRWIQPDGTVVESALNTVDASAGEFEMEWAAGETDQIGPHFGQVVITTDDIPETYPSDGSKIIWWVNPQIGDTEY